MADIEEGMARIRVPKVELTRKAEAFYNPAMEHQRDITVAALRVFSSQRERRLSVCDPLAGTGVRSIRIALEVPGIGSIVANDASQKAFGIMWKNVEDSGIPEKVGVSLENRDASEVLFENRGGFDYVDIDPYGSPVPFLPSAARSLRHGSLLACTATDTGALCGSFPSTCLSRYGIKNVKTDFFKETGVRVLTTSMMMQLARFGLSFEPVYTHANHYFRVIGVARRKKSLLSSQFRDVGLASYCQKCLYRAKGAPGVCPECGGSLSVIGPLWTGPLTEKAFCRKMLSDMESRSVGGRAELGTAIDELDIPFYYNLHRLFRSLRKSPSGTGDIMDRIRSGGYGASRTHLCPTGILTDAPHGELLSLL